MEINTSDYDINSLRSYLEDYYGTAMTSFYPFVMADLIDLSNKNDNQILFMAINMGINIDDFYLGKKYSK